MTTIYLAEETPQSDSTKILDSVLLNLRKELCSDLKGISDIVWAEYEPTEHMVLQETESAQE